MLMFIIGFVAAWLLLGAFFYFRGDHGAWSIWEWRWDSIVMILPSFPVLLLIEFIKVVMKKISSK